MYVTNVWVLDNIKPQWTMESRASQEGLTYLAPMTRKERGMENDVMLGRMSGKELVRWWKRRGEEEDQEKDVLLPSWVGAPQSEQHEEILPRISTGIEHDLTAQKTVL